MLARSPSFSLVLLVVLLLPRPSVGQADETARFTLMLRGVPLSQALEEVVRVSEIDLIYSSALTADESAYCDGRDLQVEPLLSCVLAGSGLDFVRTSAGTYVVVDARREAALYGHLAGRIVDRTTGEPLPAANVLLADASIGTTTDDAGFFHFSSVVSGMHRVHVTYIGYETATDSVLVNGGETHRAEIALNPSTLALEPIIIDGLVERLPSRGLGSGSVDADVLRQTSSFGSPDVARTAASIAGVSIRHPLADLHIQGSGAGEHLTLLDEVPVRDPVTLGRHLGAFSPLAIRRVTVHKAGFGAAHGGHLSGVVRIDHDVSAGDGAHASVLVDPISFSGKVQGRVGLSEGMAANGMVSIRTGLWNVYRDPGVETLLERWNAVDPILAGVWIQEPVRTSSIVARRHRPDVAFSDLHGAARIELSPFRTLDVSGYRASNRLGSELVAVNAHGDDNADQMLLTIDEYDWTNWAGQIRHSWLVGARSSAAVQGRASSHSSVYRYLSAHEDVPTGLTREDVDEYAASLHPESYVSSDEENVINEFAAEANYSRSVAAGSMLDLSLEALRVESRFRLRNQFIAPFSHDLDTWQLAAHATGEWSVGMETVLEPGVRLTYLPTRQSVYAEPRLAIRHDRASSAIGPFAVRVAGGLYRQFIPSYSLTSSGSTAVVPYMRFWLPLDRTLAPPQSYHLSAEALFTPIEHWSFGIEAFNKWQPRLLSVDYARLLSEQPSMRPWPDPVPMQQSDFLITGSGRAYGATAGIAFDNSRLSTELEYAFTDAERRYANRFDGELQPVPWSEPHRLSGSVSYRVIEALSIYADGDASWNRSWAFRRAYYDYLALRSPDFAIPPFSLEDPSRETLPAYYSVNLGLAYNADFSALEVQIRAAILNVLDRQNVYDWSVEQENEEFRAVPRTLPGRRPAVSVRLMY